MFNNNLFCERLKNLRLSNNLTMENLGAQFSVTKQTISRWESGDRLPPLNVTYNIAKYFNVSIDYLVGLTDNNINTIQNTTSDTLKDPILSEKHEKLIKLFDTLDSHNQGALLERATMLSEEQRKKSGIYKKSV